jgi:pyruvate dehydrogenase E1 component alpha subunit
MATRRTAAKAKPDESEAASEAAPQASRDELLRFYREMLLIRRFEEKAGQLYGMGLIGGFCHLYIGQEAVVVGLEAAAEPGDKRVTSYRDHGHMLACGMDPKGVMAELTGREGATPRARAARCTCSPRRRTSTAATGSWRRRCPSARGSRSRTSTAATTG